MSFQKIILPIAAIVLIAGAASVPAFAQNRFMDEARESANRRAENKAVREAENPAPVAPKPAATASTAVPNPAETTPAAQTVPAEPAAPAATPAPAPAQ